MALVYEMSTLNGPAEITGYTDSDWAGDLDDRKSTSGYFFKLAGAAVTWSSRKQSLIAQSTTEAEYIGCSEAAREAVWLRHLLRDLQAEYPINPPSPYTQITKDRLSLQKTPVFTAERSTSRFAATSCERHTRTARFASPTSRRRP
jgi:hypothetical protein